MSSEISIDKEKLDMYLKEVGKEYRKLGGKKMPAEIILIGGASVLANYGFRDSTTDIDALINASSVMKEAINHVGDRYGLPNNWLNADFRKTTSFSDKIVQYSEYYRTFANVMTVRTIKGEYLIAMKLKSGRKYKYDLSDVIGVLADHERLGTPISLERIKEAVAEMYGEWDELPELSRIFIEGVFKNGDYEFMRSNIRRQEAANREELIRFEWKYPHAVTTKNVNEIVAALEAKNSNENKIE